ncbi:8-oxoguanine DNA glycosylase OGG fold protein [Methylobacterium oxalidis]
MRTDVSLVATDATNELDFYHETLLRSERTSDRLAGLLSIVFWGFFASADYPRRKANPARALVRAAQILHGRTGRRTPEAESTCASLDAALLHLRAGRVSEALKEAMAIDYMGMSFASKLLMFASPHRAVVYDKVISERLATLAERDPQWRSMAVATSGPFSPAKGEAYERWCAFCAGQAERLNDQGSRWRDRSGEAQSWRAVDVERTFFALTRPAYP